MATKVCTKCNTEKPISDYYKIKYKNGKDYTYTYCKKCHYYKMTKKTSKQWRTKNKDKWNKVALKAQRDYLNRQSSGVYLLFTTKGLYVGQTSHIRSRIYQHKNFSKGNVGSKGAKVLSWIVLQYEDNYYERRKAEKKWIKRLNPALNIQDTKKYKPVGRPKKSS